MRTRARPILTCTRKPLRKLLYLASSDRRGCLAGPRRTAALAMRSCRAAQSQTTRADQGGHLRVERPLCGVRMRDSAVGGEGCCCADKGRSHVIMEDSVLFSSLPGRHGGVHSHRQPDQRPPVRDLQHARHTHEAHTDLSTRQHRGANAPWRAWVVGSPARRSHVSMPFWTSTSSRLSLAIRAARATARLIGGADGHCKCSQSAVASHHQPPVPSKHPFVPLVPCECHQLPEQYHHSHFLFFSRFTFFRIHNDCLRTQNY